MRRIWGVSMEYWRPGESEGSRFFSLSPLDQPGTLMLRYPADTKPYNDKAISWANSISKIKCSPERLRDVRSNSTHNKPYPSFHSQCPSTSSSWQTRYLPIDQPDTWQVKSQDCGAKIFRCPRMTIPCLLLSPPHLSHVPGKVIPGDEYVKALEILRYMDSDTDTLLWRWRRRHKRRGREAWER